MRLRDIKVFSKDWFIVWQPLLLLAVNFPDKSIRADLRFKLGIDLDRNILVNWLYPHAFRIKFGNEYQTTFYSKDIFARALYHEWKFIWNLVHKWDTSFANKFMPALNLGFDTLTKYSDTGTGSTTIDGYGNSGTETWYEDSQTAWDNAKSNNTSINNSSQYAILYMYAQIDTEPDPPQYRVMNLCRAFMTYDTSSLGSNASISAAKIELYTYNSFGGTWCIVGNTQTNANSFASSDWSKLGDTIFVLRSSASMDSYNIWSLDSSGIENISKTGISKYGIREYREVNSTFQEALNDNMQFYLADATSNQQRLVVTYTTPSSFKQRIIII